MSHLKDPLSNFLLLDRDRIDCVFKKLGATMERLPKTIHLNDFNKIPSEKSIHLVRLSLEIDGRKFPRQKFLVTPTADNVIIGQEWFARHRVGLFPAARTLIWPQDTPALASYSSAITVPQTIDPLNISAQADMVRRDRLMVKEEKQAKVRQILQRPWRNPNQRYVLSSQNPTRLRSILLRFMWLLCDKP